MNREEEYKTFLSSNPGGMARWGFDTQRRRADENLIRVLKRIANQKQPRFYKPPAIITYRESNNLCFQEFEYPEDILEWIHCENN